MKIAYLLIGQIKIESGIHKKILTQVSEWAKLGHEVSIFHISNDSVNTFINLKGQHYFERISNIFIYSIGLYRTLGEFADVIYMRYAFINYQLIEIIKRTPTIVEINSDDISEYKLLKEKNWKYKIKFIWNHFNRRLLFKNAQGHVYVTYELSSLLENTNYHKASLVVPNGIYFEEKGFSQKGNNNKKPLLVFIGTSGQPWHGLDKILKLAEITINELDYCVIGTEATQEKNIPPNIKFHGFLQRKEYERTLLAADIGIGSLALHRKFMNEACPLKIREYLKYGLPVLVGYEDTAFKALSYEPDWILKISNDEDNIIKYKEDIVRFSIKMKDRKVLKDEIAFMDVSLLEKKRICFMERICENHAKNFIYR